MRTGCDPQSDSQLNSFAPAPARLRQHAHDVVAIFNTSPDAINLLQDVLEHAGMSVVCAYTFDTREGNVDLHAFLRIHRPNVILYDIAPPCKRNWQLLEQLRQTVLTDYRFVITSTNRRESNRGWPGSACVRGRWTKAATST